MALQYWDLRSGSGLLGDSLKMGNTVSDRKDAFPVQSSFWKQQSGLLLTMVPDMPSFVQACLVLDKQIASLPCMFPPSKCSSS